jgi:hypothetical protein
VRNQTVETQLANPFIPSTQLIAFINHTNQRTVRITISPVGSARVILLLTTNSLILTPHTPNAIKLAITCSRSLYFALIHFLPEASSAVSMSEKSIINTPPPSSHMNALFS